MARMSLAEALKMENPYESRIQLKEDIDRVDDVYSRANPPREGFTKADQKHMYRMGKVQELKRSYRPLSALSFAVVLTAVWEYLMLANTEGLVNGGPAGLFWSYIWTFIGFTFVEMSLAEMASMAPTSGGQYHWVSEFAPPSQQRFLSYIVGWMSTLSWQAGNAADCYITGRLVQGLISVNNPDYEPQRWQGTLLIFVMVLLLLVVNIWGHDFWPKVQNPIMIIHALAFCGVVIVLWVLAPKQDPKVVFTKFHNGGGWNTQGLSLMVGQISAIYALLGSDATAHMAEEVRDAGRYVPLSLFWSYIGNGLMAIVFLIVYVFSIDDVDAAINDPTGYPFIYVFKSAMNTAGVNALTIIVLFIVTAANINFGASTARQTFAFARDKGLPGWRWISKVDREKEIPANAVLVTSAFTILLSLINIGSETAFNAIISLQVVSLMCTYATSISCVLYRRIKHPDLMPVARWSLGKWGVPINIIGFLYSVYSFFWSFWPGSKTTTAEDFNWAIVIFLCVFALCLVMYYVKGRKIYEGPVTSVRMARLSI